MKNNIFVIILLLIFYSISYSKEAHCFRKCGQVSTAQYQSYTATFGENHDYQAIVSSMSYRDNGDCTITDLVTGLMWSKCGSANQTCSGGVCNMTSTTTYTWEGAISACEGYTMGGYSDWRLPNIKELFSLVRFSGSAPYINTTYFSCVSGYYWSSTTYVPNTAYAMGVNFNNGYAYTNDKTNDNYVRCVRAGP